MTIDADVEALAPESPAAVAALTAIGEASDQGYNGMQAVINSAVNRAKNPGWWGDNVRDVCLAHEQYDCWLPGPDRTRMLSMPVDNKVYQQAMTLARLAVAGTLPDITGGADSYYSVAIEAPAWAKAETSTFTKQIGMHRFYITGPEAKKLPMQPETIATPVERIPAVVEAPISIPVTT